MSNQDRDQPSQSRTGIIRTVQTPLGFFVLVVLVVEAILGGIALAGNPPDSTYALFGMTGVLIVLVAVVALMACYRPEALRGLRTNHLPVQATVIYPPTEKDRYNRLFDGFAECDFYAFNPPFEVEHGGDRILEEALLTHEARYRAGVKSRYLFFDRRSYENGEQFFGSLAERTGMEEIDSRISRVCWDNPPELPGYTFFIGRKRGTSAIVLYPRAVMEHGIPRAVIYIEGAEDLLSILRAFFLGQWNDANRGSTGSTTEHG